MSVTETDSLAAQLEAEGFPADAILYALQRLAESPDVSRPLPWTRKVCERFQKEGAPWEPCGDCERGWLIVEGSEIGDGCRDSMERCSCHPNFMKKGARGR